MLVHQSSVNFLRGQYIVMIIYEEKATFSWCDWYKILYIYGHIDVKFFPNASPIILECSHHNFVVRVHGLLLLRSLFIKQLLYLLHNVWQPSKFFPWKHVWNLPHVWNQSTIFFKWPSSCEKFEYRWLLTSKYFNQF